MDFIGFKLAFCMMKVTLLHQMSISYRTWKSTLNSLISLLKEKRKPSPKREWVTYWEYFFKESIKLKTKNLVTILEIEIIRQIYPDEWVSLNMAFAFSSIYRIYLSTRNHQPSLRAIGGMVPIFSFHYENVENIRNIDVRTTREPRVLIPALSQHVRCGIVRTRVGMFSSGIRCSQRSQILAVVGP